MTFGLARENRIPPYAADFTWFAQNTPRMSAKDSARLMTLGKFIRGLSRRYYSPRELDGAVEEGISLVRKYD